MHAELSEEQQQLQAMAVSLARDLGTGTTADLSPDGAGSQGWEALVETGLIGVHLPETAGGGGGGTLELCLVVQAFAAELSAVPLLGAALAADVLHRAGRVAGADAAAQAGLELEALLSGEARTVAAFDAQLWNLGETLAPDAAGANRLLLWTSEGLCTARCEPVQQATGDRSRVAATPGETLWGPVFVEVEPAQTLVLLLAAADLVGVGQAALADAVAYSTQRQQFGVPVGSFQALKHLAADAHVALTAAQALTRAAAWSLDRRPGDEALVAARQAKAVAAEAGLLACETACQMLGGVGHTWEHLASVRLRRALLDRTLGGGETAQYAALAHAAPLPPPEGVAEPGCYDLRDTSEEAAFRSELRAWLAAHHAEAAKVTTNPATSAAANPKEPATILAAPIANPEEQTAALLGWQRELGRAGWIGVSFPTESGGRGLAETFEAIVNDEIGQAGVPPIPSVAHMALAVDRYGTPEQRAHLRSMLSAEQRWCQGFSEPDAGSDLAAVATRAELRKQPDTGSGDACWVVTGRKIWTSEAAWAQWCLLLCRTEPEQLRHRGLSVLLVPMDTPGIHVSPIVTAWGTGEFAEVTFDGAQVAADALLGERGQGWEIAMSLLEVERGPADMGWISRLHRTLLAMASAPADRQPEVARTAAWLQALQQTVARTLTLRSTGGTRPGEGSVDKLLLTRVDQMLHSLFLDLAGAPALLADAPAVERYLWSRAAGTFGGTSQIQRNIVAERLLGMPR